MKNKLWKLAKMIMNFKEYETEQGKLVVNGEIEVGTEVAVENENGELQPAEGEYVIDGLKVTVEAGKITEVEQPEPENEPEQEQNPGEMEQDPEPEKEPEQEQDPEPDEKDLKIQELEGLLADRDAIIEELTAKLKELEDKLNKPVEQPVKMGATVKEITKPQSGALKFFQDK